MTVTELIERLQKYNEEIGCNGKSIAAHNLESQVSFYITNKDFCDSLQIDDSEYPQGIELDLMFGCLCANGVTFNLKIVKD